MQRAGFKPGLLWLQAPQLEDLARTVWAWWLRYPPAPLEDEWVLIPSNGMAEWFKAEAARSQGILSACRIELPARFAWRLYRTVLGPQAAGPGRTDKLVLPWYLAANAERWATLPALQPTWASIAQRHAQASPDPTPLSPGSAELLRWCSHAADLFDQYQWFRPDWLHDWAQGRAQLRLTPGTAKDALAVPPEQAWQAALWQWLANGSSEHHSMSEPAARVDLHEACLKRLRQAPTGSLTQLPGRLVLFGSTALPPVVLELLEALARHALVVMAVPSPCQVHWTDLGQAPNEGQPLLAAWGRQSRDFIAQVEALEGHLASQEARAITRVEPGAAPSAHSALTRLQASVHHNEPLMEVRESVRREGLALDDGSIRFIRAHTALREVEVLHDHLLHELTATPGPDRPQARDVVVMVPDLRTHAAAIRAVFGAYGEHDPRHIPWGLADQQAQADRGLPALADWLLSLPTQRCTAADLLRLLELNAVCRRWGWDEEDRRALGRWVQDSGIRWGLSLAHRQALGLGEAGAAMTWQFGVDRMLAGYAIGSVAGAPWAPVEGVQGLAARAAGQLAGLLRRLEAWRSWASEQHPPAHWAQAFRALWVDLLDPSEPEEERDSLGIDMAVADWLRHTQAAGFEAPVGLDLVRLAVMEQVVQPPAQGRFRSSGVTFCTLMPLRAVPFRIVCLLGMDEGQYPRPVRPRHGDLLALHEVARPGDRSRRQEDRQLLLDALLSARQQLVVSWVGQQPMDRQHRPPSVLVGQLRDVLAAVWGDEAVKAITFDHPLQPFNAGYFIPGRLPQTHAHEWQPGGPGPVADRSTLAPSDHSALDPPTAAPEAGTSATAISTAPVTPESERIMRWLKCPVAAFWEDRLHTRWPRAPQRTEEDEPMAMDGLQGWAVWQEALAAIETDRPAPQDANWAMRCWAALQARGLVPLAAPGRWVQAQVLGQLQALLEHRSLLGLAGGAGHRLVVSGSAFAGSNRLKHQPKGWRLDLLVQAWWLQTLEAAKGVPHDVHLLAPDVWVHARPTEAQQAVLDVQAVSHTLAQWMAAPRPQPATSRLVAAAHGSPSEQRTAWSREGQRNAAWRQSFGAAQGDDELLESGLEAFDRWPQATEELYGPFWRWCNTQLQLVQTIPRVGSP